MLSKTIEGADFSSAISNNNKVFCSFKHTILCLTKKNSSISIYMFGLVGR